MWRLNIRLFPALLIAALLVAPAGCKRRKKHAATAEDEPTGLATMVHTADPRSTIQLVRGFYPVEQGAWRWTQKTFAVTLKPPAGSSKTGATLQLTFAIPEAIIQKLGPVTLSANIGDLKLDPEKYAQPGDLVYTRELPASVMKGDAVTVEFSLDKALPPGDQDTRELGIVVKMAGFEARQ
jgi:hypothetical protein